jgi:hypothetical protein
MTKTKKSDQLWLTSKTVMKELKIRACDLAHMRADGKFIFVKKGNSYLYDETSVRKNIKKDN